MNIFIYGDSNTWGQIPNINGYSKDAVIKQYPKEQIWWYPLTKEHSVFVNGLPGRAIANDNPWLSGRNASLTIENDLYGINPELVIIQLGTNDCKSRYGLSASDITNQLKIFTDFIKEKTNAMIMIISPAIIKEGNKITDKFYKGAEQKSKELDKTYKKLAMSNGYIFISGVTCPVGEDGEHLTLYGHKLLSQKIVAEFEKINANQNEKI